MWGAWATGMAASDPSIAQRFERLGMGTIRPESGLAVLVQLLRSRAAPSQVLLAASNQQGLF